MTIDTAGLRELIERIAEAIGQVRISDESVHGSPTVPLLCLADLEERKAIARAALDAADPALLDRVQVLETRIRELEGGDE